MSKHRPVRNEALYRAMVEMRRSSKAQPHRNRAKYTRTTKHRPTWEG